MPSCKLKFFEDCKDIIQLQCLKNQKAFFPEEVWKELDNFFGLKPRGIAPSLEEEENYRLKTKAITLNEMIDFDMFANVENNIIQWFCQKYESLIRLLHDTAKNSNEISKLIATLDEYRVTYIPFECIKTAYNFVNISMASLYLLTYM